MLDMSWLDGEEGWQALTEHTASQSEAAMQTPSPQVCHSTSVPCFKAGTTYKLPPRSSQNVDIDGLISTSFCLFRFSSSSPRFSACSKRCKERGSKRCAIADR